MQTHIYGFEDYNVVSINANVFKQTWDYFPSYYYDYVAGNYIITQDLPVKVSTEVSSYFETVNFTPSLCENHKELLNSAKKVYVHPSCKLSRSMMAEKYKKSLNPFLSDAIIIPKPCYDDFRIENCVLFINEQAKILVKVRIYEDDDFKETLLMDFKEGECLKDWMTCGIRRMGRTQYNIEDVLDAGFIYIGQLLFIPNTHSYAMDILTSNLPKDKIVFEESVQDSLGDETNQLTFDSLVSIRDMLDSTDANTVSAGLKALSMMDWMHYPNSVKYIMNQTDKYKWLYNKASNSTSVKYMLSTISNSKARRHWPGSYDNDIYEQDFELFKQLKMHYEKISNDDILTEIKFMNFIRCNAEGKLVPNLRMSI